MNSVERSALNSVLSEFCPGCGAILPLPVGNSPSAVIHCPACGYGVPITRFNGLSSSTTIAFNSKSELQKALTADKVDENVGPIVERKCWKCSHEKMYYKTLQTRSADEGQTVFYYCVNCGAQENENS